MIRSMPHKQSRDTVRGRGNFQDYLWRQATGFPAQPVAMPHIVKRGGLWACWTTPGDHSMPARQARDWVRLANFKLENAPCTAS